MGRREKQAQSDKAGVWFEEAQNVFSDPHGRLFYDLEHSLEEDRFILLGVRNTDALIRIISARKATKKEVRFYEEGI